jgi:hypothetical protein
MKTNRLDGKIIEIGGLLYRVKYRNRIYGSSKKIAIRGEIDFDKRTIEIEKGMSPSEEITTLIHELCHGCLDAIVPSDVLAKVTEMEELVIGPFSRLLAGALRSAGLLKE